MAHHCLILSLTLNCEMPINILKFNTMSHKWNVFIFICQSSDDWFCLSGFAPCNSEVEEQLRAEIQELKEKLAEMETGRKLFSNVNCMCWFVLYYLQLHYCFWLYPLPTFYPRVLNNTTIDFTSDELALLNKGMKYNLHYKQKCWITTLALEAETVIRLLPPLDQDPIQYQVNKNIQHLLRATEEKSSKQDWEHHEKKGLNNLKKKLELNKAMIIKADKENSIYLDNYYDKIQEFIDYNNFTCVGSDPTKKYQREVRGSINGCPHVIPLNTKWRHVVMNPTSPQIRGLIKVHKPSAPVFVNIYATTDTGRETPNLHNTSANKTIPLAPLILSCTFYKYSKRTRWWTP